MGGTGEHDKPRKLNEQRLGTQGRVISGYGSTLTSLGGGKKPCGGGGAWRDRKSQTGRVS